MNATTPPREIGRSSALLMTSRWCDRKVDVERPIPGIIILVHGVNDTGANYHAFENGLCAGLNERLDRDDLFPNDYTLPVEGEDAVPDPDKVFYRLRNNSRTRSPVIPFYWGYRAHERDVASELVNNEVIDRHGNRLDRDFAKGGGMFANATSTIPDMFAGHFRVGLTVLLARMGADVAHPLREAPDRRYMALAAKRLQALIDTIRHFDPDETVTVIGHSQGCLIALLAQAWLERPADCLILNHPPYGLHEPGLDRRSQTGDEQQTSRARVETLVNLVNKVSSNRHPSPSLENLRETPELKGTAGSKWSPEQGTRAGLYGCEQVAFAERDNRGKVYLYFCPHDLTVGLSNVRGIGTFGVPDTLEYADANGKDAPRPVLDRLGSGFFQRVWTWRQRDNSDPAVGLPSPYRHVLRLDGEEGHDANWIVNWTRCAPDTGETRAITGETLTPAFTPSLHHEELDGDIPNHQRYQGSIGFDPIDASIAVSNSSLGIKEDSRPDLFDRVPMPTNQELEAEYNEGKPEGARTKVYGIKRENNDPPVVIRSETPFEARKRFQDDKNGMPNSYHSAIVSNQEHHRWVTAMDVAIGQGKSIGKKDWRKLLMAIADWRESFDPDQIEHFNHYSELPDGVPALLKATWDYYQTGNFPHTLLGAIPDGVVHETHAMLSALKNPIHDEPLL